MSPEAKICDFESLMVRLPMLARPLVMTNGVFDIIHRGHVSYLNGAATMGRTLLVAVNSDDSVRSLNKGSDRPLNAAQDRAYVLGGLSSVDLVVVFTERTPVRLIARIKPDVYVKGGDYDIDELEESKLVRSWGGTAMSIPLVDGVSTTRLVSRIRQQES